MHGWRRLLTTIEPPVSDHPKMQRLSGRLREVVVYKNRTTEASSKERSRHIYFMEDNLLHAMSKSRHVQF